MPIGQQPFKSPARHPGSGEDRCVFPRDLAPVGRFDPPGRSRKGRGQTEPTGTLSQAQGLLFSSPSPELT